MILIAEAGSSKTDWRLLNGPKVEQFRTGGFNAVHEEGSVLLQTMTDVFAGKLAEVQKFYLYGAGITGAGQGRVYETISRSQPHWKVEVAGDLLGAARALFGKEPGVVGILGTGSAACEYDGRQIVKRIPSLGYILGDEGGGIHLGKELLSRYLRGKLKGPVTARINEFLNKQQEAEILLRIYGSEGRAILAGIGGLAMDHQRDPEVLEAILKTLSAYFDAFLLGFDKRLRIRLAGSVAHFLSNIIRKIATDRGLHVDMIAQSPIAGLTLYHQQYG